MPRIVVVEDEPDLRRDLAEFLRLREFEVSECASAEAFEALPAGVVDLVLLDLGLPDKDGLLLLAELKAQPSCPPVVVLTALGGDADHLRGLAAGADAYVVKNRSLPVIEATCRSVLARRGPAPRAERWTLAEAASTLQTPDGLAISLTHQEVLFMKTVMADTGRVVSRDRLLTSLDKPDTLSNLRNLDTCVARLRRKVLAQAHVELPVRSVYGEGYVFHPGATSMAAEA